MISDLARARAKIEKAIIFNNKNTSMDYMIEAYEIIDNMIKDLEIKIDWSIYNED